MRDRAVTQAKDMSLCFFFFNDTATTEIYTLSLHDALPICSRAIRPSRIRSSSATPTSRPGSAGVAASGAGASGRSEEHTSELQSRQYLVCRLLLEKKNKPPFILSATGTAHSSGAIGPLRSS